LSAIPVASTFGRANAKITREDLFRSVVEVCSVGIVLVDPLGEIILANSELERMFGFEHDELLGQSVDALVPKNLRARHHQHRIEYATHPERRMGKGRSLAGRRKDGTEIQLEIGLDSIRTSDGVFAVGVFADISDRTHIQSLKDEFVATVSHELRTPLTSIAGALALLTESTPGTLPDSAARLLSIAHKNAQRLVRLVNSILIMEKVQSGELVFVLKQVEVAALVKEVIEVNQPFADGYGIRIRLDEASTAGEVRADPDWLTQVVTNLLSNAIKFSPAGEEVIVTTEDHGGAVCISVRDHGRGIPDEFKPHVFERFAQGDASNARELGGTGLGLSIVKQIVMRLGGEVTFHDAPGGGTTFQVTLPEFTAAEPARCESSSAPAGASPSGQPL
jgi:PAS domain S-box-containing protein